MTVYIIENFYAWRRVRDIRNFFNFGTPSETEVFGNMKAAFLQ